MRQVSPISEEPVLAHLERRLVHEFPRVSPEHVDAVVRREHARFDASPIRGFIPLFIEKHVRDELGHAT
ncbi:three-helix bundle dimerization domain-containing protein [Mycobacterium sp. 1164966.3]|uniref:three-helix bundle dimerization domain-containing protein n=1 Tax=Mycobacterium sp. 1164966.3 TaxID=1856861 RepID=UPI000A7EFF27